MTEPRPENPEPVSPEPERNPVTVNNPYRLAREVENDALARMTGPSPKEIGWDEGYAAGLRESNAYPQAWHYGAAGERARVLALLDSEAADVHQRALFVMFEAIFDDDDMPAAGDYYRISRAALAAVRQLIQENTDA